VSVEFRNPKGVPKPISDYSQVAIVPAGTKMLFVSGQVALDENGTLVGKGDAAAQTEQILKNIRRILEDAGGGISSVVSWTWYFTNMDDRVKVLELRKRVLAGHAPASTGIEVSRLAQPDWLVEIECVASIKA
jgi:enamine deaminase RidA (YjgF/YER057c/UK114 family)